MMGHILLMSFLCMTIISKVVVGHDINSNVIEVSTSFQKSGYKCNVQINVVGKGVSDSFTESCSNSVPVITKEEYFIFGNPKVRKFCLYSETWNTLVLINGNTCTKKTYEMSNGLIASVTESVSADDCQAIKNFMIQKLQRAQKPSVNNAPFKGRSSAAELTPTNSWNSNSPYSKTPQRPGMTPLPRPSYKGRTSDQPSGASHSSGSIPEEAYGNDFHSTVNTRSSYGNHQLDRVFTVEWSSTITTSIMGNGQDINSNVIEVSTSFQKSGYKCNVQINVVGKGVSDSFTESCSNSVPVITKEEYFIFGNPKVRKFCLYSETWNTLVLINGDTCTKKTYEMSNGLIASVTESVSADDCRAIKHFMIQKLQRALKPSVNNAPSKGRSSSAELTPINSWISNFPFSKTTQRPDRGRPSSPSYKTNPSQLETGSTVKKGQIPKDAHGNDFHSTVKIQTSYGGSTITISIIGNGVYEVLEHKSSVKPNLQMRRSDSRLIIYDPNFDEIAVYSNEPSTLVVVKKGTCEKRRYNFLDAMSTKITFHKVSDQECASIMQEMKDLPPLGNPPAEKIWNFMTKDVENYQRQMGERFRQFFNQGRRIFGFGGLL